MDVIGREPTRDGLDFRVSRSAMPGRRVLAGGGLALTAGVLLDVLVGRADSAGALFGSGTGDLTGSLVLELRSDREVGSLLSDQVEYRDLEWKGTIALQSHGDHAGTARLSASASYVPSDSGPLIVHTWGTAEVTLDAQSCTGTFGDGDYRDTGEGGGSLHLRCDGGSLLGATVRADGVEPPAGSRDWRITLALTDGYRYER